MTEIIFVLFMPDVLGFTLEQSWANLEERITDIKIADKEKKINKLPSKSSQRQACCSDRAVTVAPFENRER